ncbi:DUF2243 domain-containing protein [Paenibacillus chartarius]|uniref:DUF2243 domain-containing protein n=1 Tax=Paenibacillus chartarius TaxID=747481 RepID=A0ABV6DHI5_9BACL
MEVMFRSNSQQAIGAFVLGLGLLGAVDGIVFHQLLQWHSVVMHTDRHGQIESDGWFHLATTILLAWGAILLWHGGRDGFARLPVRQLIGLVLLGGGAFNIVEGLVNHHWLQIHHVKQGDPHELWYDVAFLVWGAVMVAIGLELCRKRFRQG